MRYPSKITSYNESILSKFPAILNILSDHDANILELYMATKKKFTDVEEFIDALDCLYAMQQIEFDVKKGVMSYVGRNIL